MIYVEVLAVIDFDLSLTFSQCCKNFLFHHVHGVLINKYFCCVACLSECFYTLQTDASHNFRAGHDRILFNNVMLIHNHKYTNCHIKLCIDN